MVSGRTVARCSSLLLAALSTGVLFGTKVSLGPSTRHLTPATYVEVQQATVRNLRPVMGALLPGAAAANVVVLALAPGGRRSSGYGLTLGALATQLVALTLTGAIELPINARVLTWDRQEPPPGWEATRDRWDRVHTARTVSSVVGLGCLVVAMASPDPQGRRRTGQL